MSLTKRFEYKYYQSIAFEQKGSFTEALEMKFTMLFIILEQI
ncbi:MAG: hypothetical protein ACXAEU_26115 [Candidatus Hodarchaeales archaeon]